MRYYFLEDARVGFLPGIYSTVLRVESSFEALPGDVVIVRKNVLGDELKDSSKHFQIEEHIRGNLFRIGEYKNFSLEDSFEDTDYGLKQIKNSTPIDFVMGYIYLKELDHIGYVLNTDYPRRICLGKISCQECSLRLRCKEWKELFT